jgi:hypothetical protein
MREKLLDRCIRANQKYGASPLLIDGKYACQPYPGFLIVGLIFGINDYAVTVPLEGGNTRANLIYTSRKGSYILRWGQRFYLKDSVKEVL